MGLDLGPLVHALSRFALKNELDELTTPFVVFVAWGLDFLFQQA